MKRLIPIFFLLVLSAFGQSLPFPGPGAAAGGFPALAIGAHCQTNNGGSSSTTVACNMTPQAAGSSIWCDLKYPVAVFTSIADSVNSGVYQFANASERDAAHSFEYGTWYKENVAASSTTITATWAVSGANAQIACKEIKNVPTAYALDSSVLQSQPATGTNPSNPNSYTPFANNAVVLSGAIIDTGTVTAGTNFTLLDNVSTLNPEYWIQTTKTATTGPFTDASSASYAISMAAFGQNHAGNCNATMVIDFTGGIAGNTPTTVDLQLGTKGGQAQPNAENVSANFKPGWTVGSAAANITYSASAYQPLATARTCPFYTGTGTGTVGLAHTTAAVGGNVQYHFISTQPKATWGVCISSDIPVANNGTFDVLDFSGGNSTGNPDFVALQWNSNGATSSWQLEAPGGMANSSTSWTPNTWYWMRLEYNQASFHKIYIYTFSGSGCTGTPTLKETLTANTSVTGGGPADTAAFYGGGSMTYAAGNNVFEGASVLDILYGSAIMP